MLPYMDLSMPLQVPLGRETLPTLETLKRSFSGVAALMDGQGCVAFEALVTLSTSWGLLLPQWPWGPTRPSCIGLFIPGLFSTTVFQL